MKRVRWLRNSVHEDKAEVKAPNWPGGSRELVQLKMVYRWCVGVLLLVRLGPSSWFGACFVSF